MGHRDIRANSTAQRWVTDGSHRVARSHRTKKKPLATLCCEGLYVGRGERTRPYSLLTPSQSTRTNLIAGFAAKKIVISPILPDASAHNRDERQPSDDERRNDHLPAATALLYAALSLRCADVKVFELPDPNGHRQIYTVVKDPESAFSIISKDVDASAQPAVNLPRTTVALDAILGTETALLVEKLDQVNSQVYAQFKAALFGLNANPTDIENRRRFWGTLKDIVKSAHGLRRLALVREYRSEIGIVERAMSKNRTNAKALCAALGRASGSEALWTEARGYSGFLTLAKERFCTSEDGGASSNAQPVRYNELRALQTRGKRLVREHRILRRGLRSELSHPDP